MPINLYSSPMKYKDPRTNTYHDVIGVSGPPGNGIASITLNNDYTLTITFTNGTSTTTTSIRGAQGTGISSITKTATSGTTDTYTITYSDGSTSTFNVENGVVPNFSIGSVTEGSTAAATITGTPTNPVLNLVLPKADVSVTPIQQIGMPLSTITVDGNDYEIYMPKIADEYNPEQTYPGGSVVLHEGKTYFNADFMSGTTITGDWDGTKWTEVSVGQLAGASFAEALMMSEDIAQGLDLLSMMSAPLFSTSETYEVGDYVSYQYKLYKCTTAVTVAGRWNANNWTETTTTDEITSLISNKLSAPATTGTAGQILKLDSNLNPVWADASSGTNVVVTPIQTIGQKIATIRVDGTDEDIYIPTIADEYDPSSRYGEGSVVLHNGATYVCLDSVAEGSYITGEWDPDNWMPMSVGTVISVVFGAFMEIIPMLRATVSQATIASEFNTETSYPPNSYVYYNGKLYRNATNGNIYDNGWVTGHWDEVVLADEKADKTNTVLNTTLSRGRKANTQVGTGSVAFGNNVTASNYYSQAFGEGTLASGISSHAEGYNTQATMQYAHAEGNGTFAVGSSSHAEGVGSTANGAGSHAEGSATIALGTDSHAEGINTRALGNNSHAEGNATVAQGKNASATGNSTAAIGDNQHASGMYNVVDSYNNWATWTANTEYAVGDKVKRQVDNQWVGYICKTANSDSSFSTAKWTSVEGRMNFAELVGNGSSDSTRSNARALDWEGNEYLAGDIYVNANADSTGGTALGAALASKVSDVQVNGTSVVSNGVANIPIMSNSVPGVAKTNDAIGLKLNASGEVYIYKATDADVKSANNQYRPIVSYNQHKSVFYGLAKAAGDSTQSASSNSVGTYTDTAKAAIQTMLGVPAQSDIADEFDATETYYRGQMVMHDGHTYMCDVTTAGPSAWDNTQWKQASIGTIAGDSLYTVSSIILPGLQAKQDAPATMGVSGQVLKLNSNLEPVWANDNSGSGGSTVSVTQIQNTGTKIATITVDGAATDLYTPDISTKVDKSSIASEYSAQGEYEPNAFVYHDGVLYKNATNDYIIEEPWDSTHWEPAEVATEVGRCLDGKADIEDTILLTTLSGGRKDNTSAGMASIAFGANTEASGSYSQAFGFNTAATAMNAHAEGSSTIASETNAHAEGNNTVASGFNAHAEGQFTIAAADHQHVSGKYNVADNYDDWPTWVAGNGYANGDRVKRLVNDVYVGYICYTPNTDSVFNEYKWISTGHQMNYAEIIGNGEAANSRSNARALDWDGNEYLKGDLYVHANANSKNGVKVAVAEAVDEKFGNIVAPDESGLVAHQAYNVGDIFIIDDKLYKATQSIALHGSIIIDTNCVETSLSEKIAGSGLQDVQVNGTSVVSNGTANVPVASTSAYGVVKAGEDEIRLESGVLRIQKASTNFIKNGVNARYPIVSSNEHEATFYGLAKAAGDATQSASDNAVGTYTNDAKAAIRAMLDTSKITNLSTGNRYDTVSINNNFGIRIRDGSLSISSADTNDIKTGTANYPPITPVGQHNAVFYGLAKAAGDATQSSSANAVGSYTDAAKTAIKTMLGVGDSVYVENDTAYVADMSGYGMNEIVITETAPTITGEPNTRYFCGELTSLTLTPPSSGIVDIRFTSGTTATVLTVPQTVKWLGDFNPAALATNTIYEINIEDGIYGAVVAWEA